MLSGQQDTAPLRTIQHFPTPKCDALVGQRLLLALAECYVSLTPRGSILRLALSVCFEKNVALEQMDLRPLPTGVTKASL